MAKYYCLKASRPLRELPDIEWIPVVESQSEFDERVKQVQEILARMYKNARKRGRPGREEMEEDHAA